MNAVQLLETQHREVESLFEQFEKTDDATEQTRIFEQIAKALVAHDAIEREIFYPACEREMDDEDVLGEALVEHGVVEFCLFRADKHKRGKRLASYVKVLKDIVEHHVEEEEEELLPKVKRELGDERLEALGMAMEARFRKALASDFRKPLRDNLEQVLAGRTKTTPKAKASAAAPARPKGRKAAPSRTRATKAKPRTSRARAGR